MAYPGAIKQALIQNVNEDGTLKVPLRDFAPTIGLKLTAAHSQMRYLRRLGTIPTPAYLSGPTAKPLPKKPSPAAQIRDLEDAMRTGVMDREELKRRVSDWVRGDHPALQAAGARLLNDLHGSEDRGTGIDPGMDDAAVARELAPLIAFASREALAMALKQAHDILNPPPPSWEVNHEPETSPLDEAADSEGP